MPVSDTELEYNAVVHEVRLVHESLMIFKIRPDDGIPSFQPGQYTTLGLQTTEPRCDGMRVAQTTSPQLIRRAYSISHPLVDDIGELLIQSNFGYLEFYITLIRKNHDTPPSLTPRLFNLRAGCRVFVDPKAHGRYTLESVKPSDNVVFAATGTGEAPHNAMIAELLRRRHQGRIASIVSVRYRQDLGYLLAHRQLEKRFENYRFIPLTTREAENTDAESAEFVGKLYLQDVFSSGTLSDRLGWEPDPVNTHVFLCGSPLMIGVPVHGDDGDVFPKPTGMIEVLTRRGFRPDHPRVPGNVHFEKYW
jgi:ferredoxin--NADP+ reductase